MGVTLREIAKRANVSHATVSVVLNGRKHPVISELTRQKVLKVAKALGYHPNPLARALATGRSEILSLWPPEILTPTHVGIMKNIFERAHQNGYRVLMHATYPKNSSSEGEFNYAWNGDGVIALDCPNLVTAYLKVMQESGFVLPVISLGLSVSLSADSCSIDISHGVGRVLRHLKETGKGHIAFLTSSCYSAASDKLSAAFFIGISQMGFSVEVLSTKECTRQEAYGIIKAYISEGGRCDVVLAYNSFLAVGALAALREENISVPKDVSVVSCEDADELLYQTPPITGLNLPIEKICEAAWETFQQRLDDPKRPVVEIVDQASLIIRASSDIRS